MEAAGEVLAGNKEGRGDFFGCQRLEEVLLDKIGDSVYEFAFRSGFPYPLYLVFGQQLCNR